MENSEGTQKLFACFFRFTFFFFSLERPHFTAKGAKKNFRHATKRNSLKRSPHRAGNRRNRRNQQKVLWKDDDDDAASEQSNNINGMAILSIVKLCGLGWILILLFNERFNI